MAAALGEDMRVAPREGSLARPQARVLMGTKDCLRGGDYVRQRWTCRGLQVVGGREEVMARCGRHSPRRRLQLCGDVRLLTVN